MARELTIEIRAEGADQAQQDLAKVEARLQGVEKAAEKAGAATDKYDDAQRNTSIGVQKLTNALQAYAGPAAVGLAVRRTLDLADQIKELSQQSGFSTDAIQTLGHVANRAGSSFQAVANAANQLDRNLQTGGERIVRAVSRLGLSVDDLLSMQPEDRFRALGVAIGSTTDPAQRAELAMTLFGRAGRDLLPMFDDLARGAEANAPKMSGAFVDAGAEIRDAIDDILGHLQTLLSRFFLFPVAIQNWARSVSEALWGVTGELPALPGAPNSPLLAPPSTTFDPLQGNSMAFWERTLTQGAQAQMRAGSRTGGGGASLPPYIFSGGTPIPLSGSLGFPGFAIPGLRQNLNFAPYAGMLPATQNLNFAPYAGTVPMNAPGQTGSWFSRFMGGRGGQVAGAGLGMLSGLLPGMSGTGSTIGSLAGSFLGPIGGALGGLVGGLFGKLFGGGEGKKTNRTRDAWIGENFGSVDKLREAAGEAGFSLDRLLSVKKVKDFESEVAKLNTALGEHAQKRAEEAAMIEEINANILGTVGDLEGMGADLAGEFGPAIENLREMGRLSDETAAKMLGMGGQVDFRKMDEAARRLGMTDTSGLGQGYQNQRIGATAGQMVNDIDLLIRGGADLNAVLGGSKDKISDLVVDAMKFGTELPGQMKPWIEQLALSGDLVDENGEKLTDVSKLKFGAPIETEVDKLIKKLDELIGKLSGPLVDSIEDVPDVDFDINVNVNRRDRGDGGDDEAGMDGGGTVGRTWRQRSMRDTIPMWLRPGEVVLTPEQARGGMSVSIGSVSVGGGASRAQTAESVGEAVVAYMERRGVRFGRRVA